MRAQRRIHMSPLLKRFREYCLREKLEVLPGDYEYIDNLLDYEVPASRRPILMSYAEQWRQAMNKEHNELLKQAAGRRAANTWLRMRILQD